MELPLKLQQDISEVLPVEALDSQNLAMLPIYSEVNHSVQFSTVSGFGNAVGMLESGFTRFRSLDEHDIGFREWFFGLGMVLPFGHL